METITCTCCAINRNKCEHDKSLEDQNIREKYKMGHIQNTNYKVTTVNFRISLEVMKKDVTRLCINIGLIEKRCFKNIVQKLTLGEHQS